jgi:GNAT superfamily N-acetyltransferase
MNESDKDIIAFPYIVRWATAHEWETAMRLVWKTFLKFEGRDYSVQGVRNFYRFITDDKLRHAFLKGEYQMMAAYDGSHMIGIASVRNGNHLSLLFVEEFYHKKGVGSALLHRLFQYLAEEAGERYMTVKASPYAVGFYRKLGFRTVTPEEEFAGIRVTSMERFL